MVKDQMFKLTHRISKLSVTSLHHLHRGETSVAQTLMEEAEGLCAEAMTVSGGSLDLRGILGNCYESMVKVLAFKNFLAVGNVITMSQIPFAATDDEYLGGTMGFVQELNRYVVGRATKHDVASILICKDVLEEFYGQMMQFDFRNGPNRRKFDGLKYALKRVQDILYELSLTSIGGDIVEAGDSAPDAKRRKIEADSEASPSAQFLDEAEFLRLRTDMEKFDAQRDAVIKKSRDITKASKNAIYSLHRADTKKATAQLAAAEASAAELKPVIDETPKLRMGSYGGGIEEYAEAKLFQIWLETKQVAKMSDMELVTHNDEYFGGLVDFTGEVGR